MLENDAYKGWLVENKMDTPLVFTSKRYSTLKDESEWMIHKGRIPAIISEELFDQAQEIKRSKVNYQNRKGVNLAVGKYAGIVICELCGAHSPKIESKKWT